MNLTFGNPKPASILKRYFKKLLFQFKAHPAHSDLIIVSESAIDQNGNLNAFTIALVSIVFLVALSARAGPYNQKALGAPVKTVIEDHYHPYSFMNTKGEADGFSIDVLRAVAKAMDIHLEISAGSWDLAMADLEAGRIDLIPAMAYSAKRKNQFDFSVPYTVIYDSIFFRKGTSGIRSIEDLAGKTVILTKSDMAHEYLISSGLSKTMNIKFVNSGPEALTLLSEGNGDAAIMPKLIGQLTLKDLDIYNIEISPQLVLAYVRLWSFAVSKGNLELLERLNQGLNVIKNEGEYDRIYKKWFGDLEPKSRDWKNAIWYVVGGIFALLMLFIWNLHLRKTETSLRASEEKFRSLVSGAYDGMMVIRDDSSIELANSQLERMFGYDQGELLNKDYKILILGSHHPRLLNRDYLQARVELSGVRKDGKEIPVDITFSTFHSGIDLRTNCIIRDLSQIKQLENDRAKMMELEKAARKSAERASLAKDQFLATLSHELRTPLTTILGYTEELASKDLDSEIKNTLAIIENSARAQSQLVDDLLDTSRIKSGKLFLEKKIIDTKTLLAAAVEAAQPVAGRKSIHIEMKIGASQCYIFADPFRVQQIFNNLLLNAVKFTPVGGHIWAALDSVETTDAKMVEIQIRDTGKGIDPIFIEHLFERFSQSDDTKSRVHGGLGLGLSIAHSLVELHGGSIAGKSEGVGKGAVFTVRFPLVEPSMLEVGKVGSSSKVELSSRLDGIKVLAVDDTLENLILISIILKKLGAEVMIASSAAECMKILSDFRPDVVLSDISMPVEDGFALIRLIHDLDDRALRHVPVVALTAYAGVEEGQRIMAAGFSAHVTKPVNRIALSNVIAGLVVK